MNEEHMMRTRNKPEVLAPAGNLRGLKTAVDYGADAVYCGGKAFGMRSAPRNLSLEDFEEGSQYAHERGARVYVTCNVLPRNAEIEELREYLGQLKDTGVDALIVTDIGVMMAARRIAPNLEIHISTQAGVTNYLAANALYELGAKRVVLAREMDLQAVRDIRANIPDDMDIECFVHGAMCMAFSGRCLFSNYLTGRDGNHGECAQPCRWKYSIVEEKRPGRYFPIEQTQDGAYLFNSQDMNMLEHLDDLIDAGATSLKIEGRSKSAYYIAAMTNAYKSAVNEFFQQELTTLSYTASDGRIVLDTTRSGVGIENGMQSGCVLPAGETLALEIYLDRSCVEIIVNGRYNISTTIRPTFADALGIELTGDAAVRSLEIWEMEGTR